MRQVKTATRPLWHPYCWPGWIAVALLWLIARIPHRVALALGALLGPPVLALLPRRRHVLLRNLELCFPDWTEMERQRVAHANARESGRMLAAFAWGWFGSHRRVAKLPATIEGLEHIEAAHATGRGVLLVGGHFSHLELAGRLFCRYAPLAGMYREHHDPAFEWAVKRGRLRYADAMFRRDELRAAIRYLKSGGTIWYAPDQEYRRGERVFAPFFGIPAATITATHQLARLTGSVVVGFEHRREADGSYRLKLHPPLDDFPTVDALVDTTRVNRMLEGIIRAAPEQYLWLHARFKTRPDPQEASPYA
ncbi:MAG: LpxL/LpxP family Kdo(2)-lipid IV(A) lauroyl/palmitoleoyl acyltransferase [Xanthomonadales bacterium]|nr:Lipid A biosynthesis lauroyltransferase [Xanthomonadales bacterium]MCC6594347.1 LpxL/LpxP family Kdo(2)-lipid IV(A) lauroyl/palmitoleoyl acyltransferase [Xanthomonadales bacterium]MCE7930521.1 LpxL/LpxP family Kdo(2)-lipid IV(A) lauroyl/palmitoleoyl acyltransferase [Xanthomonadales bacterium PRO6]